MSLTAGVNVHNGRPVLFINGQPTTEFWCYGDPNAIGDFTAAGIRICQFHVPFPSWWRGHDLYDFAPTDEKIAEFLARAPDVLLLPRVNFGYVGEDWYAARHPDQLAVGCDLDGRPVDYTKIRARPVDCWYSSGSRQWTEDACAAMSAFVEHCETRHGPHILGYQIGGGISAEWFRWWNFVEEVYEDYSDVARSAFQEFLRERYRSDAELQRAWGRGDVTLATAAVPSPRRLHEPALGYFRDPAAEPDVIDWLDCLSHGNSGQILALAESAKRSCAGRKLVGTFYGYFWPHWNTQSAARSGHMDLQRILSSPHIDFISSPYHYDNRHRGGFHHSQTVPQTIEHAGKLHVDETDTFTHLADPVKSVDCAIELPRTSEETCAMLNRDAATVLGTAGTAWWMDLHGDRWYDDGAAQATVRTLQALAKQSLDWRMEHYAEATLVVDDRSYAWCSLHNVLNQYYSSMPRQLEWSDSGFPIDTVVPWEIAARKPYRLYIFLNCWRMDAQRRQEVLERVRRPGVTSIWFHGAGFVDGNRCQARQVTEITGIRVALDEHRATPQIDVDETHALTMDAGPITRGAMHFGASLEPSRSRLLIAGPRHQWNGAETPLFVVDDPEAVVLGRYRHNGEPGLAMVERDGWRSIFCGAPLLPGWLLRRIAALTGLHAYTAQPAQVFHRGPLVSVYKPGGGRVTVTAPGDTRLVPFVARGPAGPWETPRGAEPFESAEFEMAVDETRFFRMVLPTQPLGHAG